MLALNALSRLVGDEIENVTEMHPHLFRRDADDSNALGRKPPRASRIVLATTLVAFAIHFDRQHRLCAIEVQHIDADRMLAAELQATQRAAAQVDPKSGFGRRQSATQNASA